MNPSAHAQDKSGVSPGRLKLPKGPGSLEGVGENVTPELSMGLMAYGIPLELPAGRNGMGPSLRLGYSSGGSNSVVGFGWSLALPSVERMTSQGLPRYTRADLMAAGGSDELVAVQTAPDRIVYRARFEGGFIRYTWMVSNDGSNGYWIAEYPDGKKAWFGATAEGVAVDAARVKGPLGTFSWRLVEQRDAVDTDNRVVYGWEVGASGYPYLRTVDWVARTSGAFRYRVRLDYEERKDIVSDGRPGFDLRMDRRVRTILLMNDGKNVKSWRLGYDEAAGLSRLTRVERFGMTGRIPFPVSFEFGYSRGLGEANDRSLGPYIAAVDEPVGLGFVSGEADLLDINVDGLPDILDTADDSGHRFALNLGPRGQEGAVLFEPLTPSEFGGISSIKLSVPGVQPADIDGDGDTDLLRGTPEGGQMLLNDGTGDWAGFEDLENLNLPDFDGVNGALLRFFDVDADRRTDVLFAAGASASIYPNIAGLDGGRSFGSPVPLATAIGVGFNEGLQLADMNGDGILDAAQQFESAVRYRLNLGHGRFSEAWIVMSGLPAQLESGTQLVDINGDSLADLVHVGPQEVRLWLNRDGRSFDTVTRVGPNPGAIPVESVNDGELPSNLEGVKTRFADINGNGSTDILFVDADGYMSYLDIFPARPNLLVSIENGLGARTTITYGNSTRHMLTGNWTTRLPSPMQTLDAIESTVMAEVEGWASVERQEFSYADGYYDGEERQFRGFQRVIASNVVGADASAEPTETENIFDVGAPSAAQSPAERRYFKGLLLEKRTFAGEGASRRLIESTGATYEDCGALAGVPTGLRVPVRFICQTEATRTIVEGEPDAAVTTAEEFEYDRIGNRVRTTSHGVISRADQVSGCTPCEGRPANVFGRPCGPTCQGDERYEETTFILPGVDTTAGRWILRAPCEKRTYGRPGSLVATLERTFYDNIDAQCKLTRGLVTRTTSKVSADLDEEIDMARNVYDRYGNVVETFDPNSNRRRFEYDQDYLLPVAEIAVIDSDDSPYELRMEVDYDGVLDQVVRSRDWVVIAAGLPVSPVFETRYTFDDFGRLTSTAYPDDREGAPTERYEYALDAPTPRIIRRARSTLESGEDIEEIQCFDGRGRSRGKVNRIEGDRYLASEVTQLNTLGKPTKAWQPFEISGRNCPLPGADVRFTLTRYDGLGRSMEVKHPDAQEFGGVASSARTVYRPLVTESYDENDTDSENARDFGTPSTVEVDGLGRTVSMTRIADRNAGPIPLTMTYDELGRLRGYVDAEGNEKVQTYDLLGRIIEVRDPDTGKTTFEYDAAGNMIHSRDARGAVVRTEYDAANRAVASWREWSESSEDRATTEVRTSYDRTSHCEHLGRECSNVAGRIARIAFPILGLDGETGFDEIGYDARGRPVVRLRGLADKRFRFESAYDSAGRVTSTTYPDGETLRVRYDSLGRAKQVDGYVLGTRYDKRGVMVEATLFNGVRETHTYDARMREIAYGAEGAHGAVTAREIRRDRVGNLLGVRDLIEAVEDAPGGDADYEHDALYRLTSATLDAARPAGGERLTWQYDDLDRILYARSSREGSSPAHVGSYTYSRTQPNTVVSTEDDRGKVTRYTYDAAGFMLTNGAAQYLWDAAGRLLEVQRGNLQALRAGYGPGSDRVVKREGGHLSWYADPSFEVRDGVTTKYVSIGPRKVVKIERTNTQARWLSDVAPLRKNVVGLIEADPDGSIDAADAWVAHAASELRAFQEIGETDDAAVLLSAVARRMVEPAEVRKTGLHHDHLGSLLATTDETAQVIARVEHYPYGQLRWQSDGAGDDYEYTGKEHDDAAGLTYFGARYLDARLGRWVSADPTRTLTIYRPPDRYVALDNRPAVVVDPDGNDGTLEFEASILWGIKFVYRSHTVSRTPIVQNGAVVGIVTHTRTVREAVFVSAPKMGLNVKASTSGNPLSTANSREADIPLPVNPLAVAANLKLVGKVAPEGGSLAIKVGGQSKNSLNPLPSLAVGVATRFEGGSELFAQIGCEYKLPNQFLGVKWNLGAKTTLLAPTETNTTTFEGSIVKQWWGGTHDATYRMEFTTTKSSDMSGNESITSSMNYLTNSGREKTEALK